MVFVALLVWNMYHELENTQGKQTTKKEPKISTTDP